MDVAGALDDDRDALGLGRAGEPRLRDEEGLARGLRRHLALCHEIAVQPQAVAAADALELRRRLSLRPLRLRLGGAQRHDVEVRLPERREKRPVAGGLSAGATRTSVSVGAPPERKMTPKPKSMRSGNRNVQNTATRSRR